MPKTAMQDISKENHFPKVLIIRGGHGKNKRNKVKNNNNHLQSIKRLIT